MDGVFGILLLIVIVAIWYFFSYVSMKVEDKKIDIKKAKKVKEDTALQKRRDTLNISLPKTVDGYYPVLLLPMDREVYHFGEGYHWIKPGFNSYTNYKDDMYGASEKYFLQTLLKHFGNDKIKHNQLSVKINNDLYIPDFTYMDNDNKVYLDIEIDEPYSFKTKEPIHYKSSDHIRNIYMQRGGWAVIRFSEKQVVQQPDECCNFVAAYLTFAYMDKTKFGNHQLTSNLPTDKTWTKNEAEQMALVNYRKTYL